MKEVNTQKKLKIHKKTNKLKKKERKVNIESETTLDKGRKGRETKIHYRFHFFCFSYVCVRDEVSRWLTNES
jgi:hypothetical protein